jgi:transposase
MLGPRKPYPPTEFDLKVFETYVPSDHHLRKAAMVINWDAFHDLLAPFYDDRLGQPSEPPVLMLQLEYLRYHYNLSDSQVIQRSRTDMAFRMFLQVNCYDQLPDSSSLCRFRARLKTNGFLQIFDQVVAQARQHGLVKERLRLKDASHILADIDVPTTLGLVAQIRDQLLEAAQPFDSERVEGEQVEIELLRQRTESQKVEIRLEARVTHLKEILSWVDELPCPEDAETNKSWQKLLNRRRIAHKILDDQEHPGSGDKVRSVTDPDARRAKHGDWFDGYLLDVIVDADSELITQINVLPGNGEEAADAITLVEQEEAAHGNDVEAISIDGVGFNGPVLHTLEDAEGLDLDVYVPPREESAEAKYTPRDFEETGDGKLTCPAGQTSTSSHRDNARARRAHLFSVATCRGCAMVGTCMTDPPSPTAKHGRRVYRSDYHEDLERARAKTQTEEYEAVRREHWKVERKLGEVMNCHGGRRARSRGQPKVLIQECMACMATNIKRMIRLLCGEQCALASET